MSSLRKDPGFVTMWIVATLCVASLLLFRGPLTWNETHRIPVARHFADPSWIPNDWVLGSSSLYQIPFNILAAPFLTLFSMGTATILLRAVVYAFFASGVVALSRRLGIGIPAMIPAIMLAVAYRTRSLAAHEFMIDRVEMKSVAYAAVLWALSMLIAKRYRATAALLGLATTFHVLVGLYATLTCLLFILIQPRHRIAAAENARSSIPLYLVCGGFGIFVALHTVVSATETDAFTDLVYLARIRHHVLPSAWWEGVNFNIDLPIALGRAVWLAKAVVSVTFLGAISRLCRFQPYRDLANIALLSSLSFLVGLFIFAVGQVSLLKYQLFRFPDVLIPLATYVIFFGFLERMATHPEQYRLSSRTGAVVRLGVYSIAALCVVAGTHRCASQLSIKWKTNVPWQFVRLSPDDREATLWIRENTPADAQFLVNPFFEPFYVTAERGALVLWKHFPSDLKGVKEWHERLVAVNGGREVVLEREWDFDRDHIERSFNTMPLDDAIMLCRRYGVSYYFGPFREDWNTSPVFRAGSAAVYKLP